MNPIATELNTDIKTGSPHILEMLSDIGKQLFFPKGILSQSAEAKEKATNINATIGIATEKGGTMCFDSVADSICGIAPEAALTYAPSFGIAALRQAWQAELRTKNPSLEHAAISLPVVSNGITHGVSVFADVWVDPDDVAIVPDMMWGNYTMILTVRKKARLVNYTTFNQSGGYNVDAFEKAVRAQAQEREKIIVMLNFPHNPTGYALTKTEGARIADILTDVAQSGTNVLAVCDDAYFGLFYEQETLKESLFAKLCQRHPRLLAVKLDGATKENFVWGLRVGFITYGLPIQNNAGAVYAALEKKTAGAVRGSISNASHLSQSIVLKSMQDERYAAEKQAKFDVLQKRAERIKAVLSNGKYAKAFEPYPFNAGYFMLIRLKTVDAEQLRIHLLEKYGVGLISIGKENLRVAFSCLEEERIGELFDTILQGAEELAAAQ